jgi:hypothetical protein
MATPKALEINAGETLKKCTLELQVHFTGYRLAMLRIFLARPFLWLGSKIAGLAGYELTEDDREE